METRFIYTLVKLSDVSTVYDVPHYVGKAKDPKIRANAHKKKYPDSVFEIIDEVPAVDWKFWERFYISLYRSWGFILDNKKNHAGNGSDVLTEEHKNKISESLKLAYKKKPRSKEFYKKLGDKHKGFEHSNESKNKLALASKGNTSHLGFKHSIESKIKISKALAGKPLSEEHKLKLSNIFKGRIFTKEHGLKISQSKKGKPLSEEHKLKLSEAKKGSKFSEERKLKMSESQRLRRKNEASKQ